MGSKKFLIAGDIGGTKTNLGLYSLESGPKLPVRRSQYPSASYANLEDMVFEFLKQSNDEVTCAVFGVAGPVDHNRARITNLPWVIDAERISSRLGFTYVTLLNDLEALASGLSLLEEPDLHELNSGEPSPEGPIAVIAPGTGLGEAFLTWDGTQYRTHASEGGHADFAPRNALEIALLEYLLERHDHVSYEHVCSGNGISNIYMFLRDRGNHPEPAWLAEEFETAPDRTALIVRTALDAGGTCELCRETLRIFVSILGAEAGNVALKFMPAGGVYLGGGIPPRILGALEGEEFLASFFNKGRMTHVLTRIPVHVILATDTPLMGAARHGMDIMGAWDERRSYHDGE
ncbi:MAG: glucokinase [Desulfomonilia bacterium]|nr:glucokinase [Desulfomonilia bacterium]